MFYKMLENRLKQKSTFLCIGLEPDAKELLSCGFKGSLFDYNKIIIDSTHETAIAFKIQVAYYSSFSKEDEVIQTINYIKNNYGDIPIILDAKRGDIGSTANHYAMEAFERYNADAVTVNPYLGKDSVEPFLQYKSKGVIILARTSNESACIQDKLLLNKPLYEHFIDNCIQKPNNNVCFVVGAKCKDALKRLSNKFKNNWLLIPGVGKQGGRIDEIVQNVRKEKPKVIINVSRALYKYLEDEKAIKEYSKKQSIYYLQEIRKNFQL